MKTLKDEILFSRKQCAQFLSCTLPTLHRWTKDKILKAYQLGGRVYYKKSEIIKAPIRVN